MKVTVIRAGDLSSEHVCLWSQWQNADPAFASPYFCWEFVQAVAAVRRDVFIGVIEEDGRTTGFFPFQRSRLGFGAPVGGRLSDFHGIIALPGRCWSAGELLRQCSLVSWDFHHALASQATFRRHHAGISPSHFMDLSRGFDGYASDLAGAGSKLLKDVRSKRNKLAGILGDVRIVPNVRDPGVLHTLLRWKSEQYRRGGLIDNFSLGWARELVERIHATQTDAFAGMLSALYAGDQLVAAHFGMRSRTALNWWFPRHDEQFAKLSPGIMLRIGVAEDVAAAGIQRIDLGLGGESSYKPRLATGNIELAEGRVEVPSLATAMRRCRRGSESWIRRSRFRSVARVPGRLVNRVEDWLCTR